jgi:hypothetical protein
MAQFNSSVLVTRTMQQEEIKRRLKAAFLEPDAGF